MNKEQQFPVGTIVYCSEKYWLFIRNPRVRKYIPIGVGTVIGLAKNTKEIFIEYSTFDSNGNPTTNTAATFAEFCEVWVEEQKYPTPFVPVIDEDDLPF